MEAVPRKKNNNLLHGLIAVGVIVFALVVMLWVDRRATAPVLTPPPLPPQQNAAPWPVEPPLSREEAAGALASYLGSVATSIEAWDTQRHIYMARIQQDMEWRDLQSFRADAESLKVAAQTWQERVDTIPQEGNLSDDDSKVFEAVVAAVADVTVAEESLAVDVSVLAHTGMFDRAATAKDVAEATRSRKALKDAALVAYKHFGYPPEQIDKLTLQPKAARTAQKRP